MSKIKDLKNYIKSHSIIFDRITNGFKLHEATSFLYNYLDYKGKDKEMKIDLTKPNVVKVLKKDSDTKVVETITFNPEEVIAVERIRYGSTKENIMRRYSNNELLSLESTITLRNGQSNETKIKIRLEQDKVYVNDRDISPLYKKNNQSIEERYSNLKTNYTTSHTQEEIFKFENSKQFKSKRQIIVEEQLRTFIKEEFDYKAPLDKRDLDDLIRIINMLIKRRKTTDENIKQYTKTQ